MVALSSVKIHWMDDSPSIVVSAEWALSVFRLDAGWLLMFVRVSSLSVL